MYAPVGYAPRFTIDHDGNGRTSERTQSFLKQFVQIHSLFPRTFFYFFCPFYAPVDCALVDCALVHNDIRHLGPLRVALQQQTWGVTIKLADQFSLDFVRLATNFFRKSLKWCVSDRSAFLVDYAPKWSIIDRLWSMGNQPIVDQFQFFGQSISMRAKMPKLSAYARRLSIDRKRVITELAAIAIECRDVYLTDLDIKRLNLRRVTLSRIYDYLTETIKEEQTQLLIQQVEAVENLWGQGMEDVADRESFATPFDNTPGQIPH